MVEREKDVYQQFRQLVDEVHKVIVGNDEIIQQIVIAIFTGNHVLLESVPGMGKTMLAKAIADSMDMEFRRIQCTPDLSVTDITGRLSYDPQKKEYVLEKGVVFTNLLLVDEINRAQPKTQSALLESMAEKAVTLVGTTHKLPQPFTVMATQNPVEQAGTFPLPEAQADRFMFKSVLRYLPVEEEMLVLKSKASKERIKKIFNPPEVLIIREEIKQNVSISDAILEYILRIVDGTRKRREVQTGGSPRASIAMMESAKAKAFFEGRDYVTAKDIKELAFPVLRHRIILNPDSREFGVMPDDIISKVLDHVESPVE